MKKTNVQMILNKLLRYVYVITYILCVFTQNYCDNGGFVQGLLQGLILSGFYVAVVESINFLVIKYKSKNVPKHQTPRDPPTVNCDKHPGHTMFIASSEFDMKDLPDGYRRQDLLDFIRTFSGLVVRITVNSKSRPASLEVGKDVFESGDCVYGSGLLWNAQVSHWRVDSRCPCVDCRDSSDPKLQWGEIHVYTANHVVWGNTEAESSMVDLYYDGEEKGSIRLTGLKVIRIDSQGDFCEMSVVTHDKDVYDGILSTIEKCYETAREASEDEKLTIFQGGDYLAIIVSHPHGMKKKISVGRSKRRNVEVGSRTGILPVSYTYDTPTCPGSSGAPVLLVGLEKVTISFPPHCGTRKRNRNYSGKGIELDRANEMVSPVLFICSNKEFCKKQKVIKLWSLLRVYLRKLSTFSSSFVKQLPKKKFRKPTKKIIQKLIKFRTALINKENAQPHPTVIKDNNDSSLICNNKTENLNFLQKRDLTIKSLPEQFQDENILNPILHLCDLTGLIELPDDQFTCFIIHHDFDRSYKNEKCPCAACKLSKKPKKEWMSFVARTSSNCAQYQNNGLFSSKCLFCYDDQNQKDKYMYVYKVIKINNERKSLDIVLVTHYMEMARKIQKTLDEYQKSAIKLAKKFKHYENGYNLTVIPCHPDGFPKCVCIGHYPSGNTADSGKSAYNALWHPFEAAACRGSAGAPVFTLNGQRLCDVGINQAINISNSVQFNS